ncbi:MAG: alanine--tRNA ligase, partial [Ruminococcus sp.]|nr:alanine--tRNA ligase [Ruminococcus sp.]
MPIAEAQKLGAMALFGEKYGETVRVVTMGDKSQAASIEFCGGTHLDNTSKIGLFKIISENSVASGVRRIEAVTGTAVLELLNSNAETISKAAQTLKVNNPSELVKRCEGVMQEIKTLEKERDRLEESIAVMRSKALLDNTTQVGGVQVACAALENIKPDVLKKMADDLKSRKSELIAVMTTVNGDKANLVGACGKDAAAKGAHAGKIAGKIAALTNGKGGGRPDLAMAGVGDKALIDEALSKACDIISEFIK